MVYIHPKTRQRLVRQKHSGDIEFDAQGPISLTQEKIAIIGGWTDYTGSGGQIAQMSQPLPDELFGTNAWLEGARKKQLDELGNRKQTIRLRTKKIYVENP